MDNIKPGKNPPLNVDQHAHYLSHFLKLLPARSASYDSIRVNLAFFAVSGLDILDRLEKKIPKDASDNIIDWIYSLVYVNGDRSGFQGSAMLNVGHPRADSGLDEYKFGHLAMTYTGLAVLLALGDDLSRLDRRALVQGVAAVQQEAGNFSATLLGSENDMRFVYCAACICAILDSWEGVDVEKMVAYILKSIRYDYGISQHDEMESHGGTTFCALAALDLCGRLGDLNPETREGMIRWLVFRQTDGFNGRPNKQTDTCYSFWIGAALQILGAFELTDFERNREYIISTQNVKSGFSKWPGVDPDPLHTYFGLCGLSFLREEGLLPVMPSLNISMRSYERLKKLHQKWRE